MNRQVLLCALLPSPHDGLPALAELDLSHFWSRFDQVAPAHLRFGLNAAAFTLVHLVPRALGHRASLGQLNRPHQDEVLRRSAATPGLSQLVDVGKIVACLAYFDDPKVERRVRAPRS